MADGGSSHCGKLDGADDVVFVAVRLENMGDAAAIVARNLKINFAVAPRIDDSSFAIVSEYVGDMGDAW